MERKDVMGDEGYMNKGRRVFRVVGVLCVSSMMVIFLWVSSVNAGFIPKNPWEAQFRPGVMAGDGDNETDFTFEFFIPMWGDNESLVFFNPHFRLDDKDSKELNVGLGYRRLLFNDRLILGANVYYDTMRSRYDFGYEQVGFGLEALSKWLDMRFNYYQPINDRKNRMDELDKYRFGSTALLVSYGYEEALKGFDAEVGVLVPFISNYVETRAYVGGYWYDSEVRQDIEGRRYRLEVRPCRLINLQIEVKNDYLRGSDTYIGGYFDIPFSMADLFCCGNPFKSFKSYLNFFKGSRTVRQRMTEKVVRDRHIVVHAYREKRKRKVADIIYVNQDNERYGRGTYEDPYHDINYVYQDPRYKPGSWVYVFSWDKKADTYYTHFHLLPRMVLWGQGYRIPKYRLGGDGPRPILDGGYGEPTVVGINADGYDGYGVVNLADNNEVMGFIIQNGEHGIYGYNIKGTYIHHNIIRWNGEFDSGIHIENYFNPEEVNGRTLRYVISDNEIYGNAGYGVYLSTQVGSGGYLDKHLSMETLESPDGYGEIRDLRIENVVANNEVYENYGWYYGYRSLGSEVQLRQSVGEGAAIGIYTGLGGTSIENVAVHNTVTDNRVTDNYASGIWVYNAFSASGYGYEDGVTASVAHASMVNTVSGNELSQNQGGGISLWNSIGSQGESNGGGEVNVAQTEENGTSEGLAARVVDATIVNSVTNNSVEGYTEGYEEDYGVMGIEGSGLGISVNNLIYATAYNYGYVSGDVVAEVMDSRVRNRVWGNQVMGAYNGGMEVYSEVRSQARNYGSVGEYSIPAVLVVGDEGETDGQAPGLVSRVSRVEVGSSFLDNTVTGNGSNGISLDSEVYALADNYANYYSNAYVGGDVVSEVEDSGIRNGFEDNTVRDNGGYGIYVYNWMEAGGENFAYNHSNGEVAGNVKASMDSSSMENSFQGNTVTENEYYGVYLENEVNAWAYNYGYYDYANAYVGGDVVSEVKDFDLRTDFMDNTVRDNGSYGIYVYNWMEADGLNYANQYSNAEVAGSVKASMDSSSMENGFRGNTVTGNQGYGVYLDNEVYAWAANLGFYRDTTNAYVGGDVISEVKDFDLGNSFEDNTVRDNGDYGIYVYNWMEADGKNFAYNHSNAEVAGSVKTSMDSSSMENSFQGNTVTENEYYGVYLENEVNAWAYNYGYYDYASAYVDGDMVSEVKDFDLGNSFEDNTVRDNGDYGIYVYNYMEAYGENYANQYSHAEVAGSVKTSMDPSSMENSFQGNTVTGNQGYGVYLNNEVYAWAYNYARYYSEAYVDGDMVSEVKDFDLRTDFMDNTVRDNDGYGIYIYNYMEAYASRRASNHSQVGVWGSMMSSVDSSSIVNSFKGNTAEDNGDHGIYVWNGVHSYNVLSNGWITDLTVTNNFSGNRVTENNGDGIRLVNFIYSDYMENVDVTNTFKNNTITGNTESLSGLHVENCVGCRFGDSSYTVNTEIKGNTFGDNAGDGIHLLFSGYSGEAGSFYVNGILFTPESVGDIESELVDANSGTSTEEIYLGQRCEVR